MSVFKVLGLANDGSNGSVGSATVWRQATSEDGGTVYLLITNSHVVATAPRIYIQDPAIPGLGFPATLLGVSPSADIAVLALAAPRPPAARTAGSMDEQVAELVARITPLVPAPLTSFALERGTAVGFPLGLSQATRSRGEVGLQQFGGRLVFQISEDLNPGNSGGALFDSEGRWWGVPFAGIEAAGDLGFCITHAEAIAVSTAIAQAGPFPVRLRELSLTVDGTLEPGARLGPGFELVESMGGWVMARYAGVTAPVYQWMRLLPAGSYPVTVGGVEVARMSTNYPVNTDLKNSAWHTVGPAYFSHMTPEHVRRYPALHDEQSLAQGVVVSAVHPDSEGALHLGCRVLSVNGVAVGTLHDVERAVAGVAGPHTLVTSHGLWILDPATA